VGCLTSAALLGLFGRTLWLTIVDGSSILPITSLPQVKVSLKPYPGFTLGETGVHTQKREVRSELTDIHRRQRGARTQKGMRH